MQVNPTSSEHWETDTCERMRQVQELRRTVLTAAKALNVKFTAYGVRLENVTVFKYLGQFLAYDDVDTQAAMGNLKKTRCVRVRISSILRAENTSPRVCGIFHKATV